MRANTRDILIEVMEDVIEDLHGHVHRVSNLAVDLGTESDFLKKTSTGSLSQVFSTMWEKSTSTPGSSPSRDHSANKSSN